MIRRAASASLGSRAEAAAILRIMAMPKGPSRVLVIVGLWYLR